MAKSAELGKILVDAFEKQEFCDVKFIVEEREIAAHKMVLKSRCKLLYDLSAKWTPDKDPIPIKDIAYDSFKEFLRYLSEDGHLFLII